MELMGRGWRRTFLSPVLAVLLAVSLVMPGMASLSMRGGAGPDAMAGMANCPMNGNGYGKIPGKTICGFCILCFAAGLPNSPDSNVKSAPARPAIEVFISFATGVSATYGPRLTANPPTGPPSAVA
jgi:hypothetical protein